MISTEEEKKSRDLHEIREPNPIWRFSKSSLRKWHFHWDLKGLGSEDGGEGPTLGRGDSVSRNWQKVRVAGVWGAREDGERSKALIWRVWKALRRSSVFGLRKTGRSRKAFKNGLSDSGPPFGFYKMPCGYRSSLALSPSVQPQVKMTVEAKWHLHLIVLLTGHGPQNSLRKN